MSKQNICNEKAVTELPPPPPFRCKSPPLSAYVPLPLPPCPFQPPPSPQLVRTRQEEDPFYAAYLECTKSVQESKKIKKREPGFSFSFFCKHAGCGVREEAVVSLPRFRQLHPRRGY